jgi:hypothetical protein
MNCEILHTLYVRSNGDVPCNDDAGERILLARLPRQTGIAKPSSLFSNHNYRHIRHALQRGAMPWPDVCPQCAFFRPNEPFSDPLTQKQIRKIQIEPSLACALRCPGCSNQYQVRTRSAPLQMDPATFEELLRGLAEEGYAVAEIEYCGQGEPLLHPRFPDFVRLARTYFPGTTQRLITSGNFDFAASTAGEHLDTVMVSCDGVDPQSYQQYRVGGRVEQPIQFMRDAVERRWRREGLVVWKYILFEWNDTPDELFRAQLLAQELGVDYLLMVYTHSKGKSRRYTLATASDLPIHFPNVVTNATPIHYQRSAEPLPLA